MRIIDADALKEKAWDADTRCGYVQVVDVGDIDDAPTIVPSAQPVEDVRSMCGECDAWNIYSNYPQKYSQPQWIPCSERLPDDYATVLITHRGGVSFGWYNGRYWERGANTKHRPLQTVIAWMPLPEPYKGGIRSDD